jgi:O-antigen/teichoic acid export membrane protein
MIINYIKNSLIAVSPSVASILFSIICVPIYLSHNGLADYGNYIFLHIVSSAGLLFNLGLGKATVIEYQKNPKNNYIFRSSLIFTVIIIFTLILISLILYQFIIIKFVDFLFFIFGIVFTVFYFTLESIFQSKKKFVHVSSFNFIFFSLSNFFPIILLLIKSNQDYYQLFFISLLIKFLSLIFFLFFIFNEIFLIRSAKFKNLKLLKLSLLLGSSNIINYIYDYSDKYFIKNFLGPANVSMYSVPQQIMGKITTISYAMCTVLLPDIAKNESNKLLNHSLNFFIFFTFISIFFLFNHYDWVLKLWLKNNFIYEITLLAKIFSISYLFASISHLLATELEAKNNAKKNLKIQVILLPFFIITLLTLFFFLNKHSSLIFFIAIIIFVKEFIFLTARFFILKNQISSYHLKYASIVFIFFYTIFITTKNF